MDDHESVKGADVTLKLHELRKKVFKINGKRLNAEEKIVTQVMPTVIGLNPPPLPTTTETT